MTGSRALLFKLFPKYIKVKYIVIGDKNKMTNNSLSDYNRVRVY